MANSPLQKTPLGLLQAYNIQTLGAAPISFSDTVVPVQRAEPWYLRDLIVRRRIASTIPIGQTGVVLEDAVPVGQRWYVYGGYAQHNAPTADLTFESLVELRIFLASPSQSVTLEQKTFVPGVNWLTSGGFGRAVPFWFPEPFLLIAGDALQMAASISAAATAAHNVEVTFVLAQI